MITTILQLVSLAYVAFLGVIEAFAYFTHDGSISSRVRDWIHANYQIASFFIFTAGFLLAHFT